MMDSSCYQYLSRSMNFNKKLVCESIYLTIKENNVIFNCFRGSLLT